MASLTHAPQMLQYFARLHPEVAFTLKLNDPQVPSNNGIYTIVCTQTKFPDRSTVKRIFRSLPKPY